MKIHVPFRKWKVYLPSCTGINVLTKPWQIDVVDNCFFRPSLLSVFKKNVNLFVTVAPRNSYSNDYGDEEDSD